MAAELNLVYFCCLPLSARSIKNTSARIVSLTLTTRSSLIWRTTYLLPDHPSRGLFASIDSNCEIRYLPTAVE
jgi:hypothetical protein